jgi:hypothetical protein
MVATYAEFAAQQRTQHQHPFNRGCAVVGNYLVPVAAIAVLSGRSKTGAGLFALASAAIITGHVIEGNLPQQTRVTIRHPIWGVRADIAVANATIKDLILRK